jgi:hypothetical protein
MQSILACSCEQCNSTWVTCTLFILSDIANTYNVFFRKKTQEPPDDEVVEIDKHNEDLEAKYVSNFIVKYVHCFAFLFMKYDQQERVVLSFVYNFQIWQIFQIFIVIISYNF